MTVHPPPAPPVIGGRPRKHSGMTNHPVSRVVIHSAVVACEPGAARMLAAWNRTGSTGGSWHYATDPDETIQCSFDSYVCWHAPPNDGSIGIEMADTPEPVGSRRRRPWRWAGRKHRRMLARTAALTAELCLAYDLPIVFLSAHDLAAGGRGVTTHANVSAAFGQSTHWDPGVWPRRRFMRAVRRHAAALEKSRRV